MSQWLLIIFVVIFLGVISWILEKKQWETFYNSLKIGEEFILYEDSRDPFCEPTVIVTILDKKDNYIKYKKSCFDSGKDVVESKSISDFFTYLFVLNDFVGFSK